MLHDGRAHEDAQLYPTPGRLRGADAELAWRVAARERIGLTLGRWRDPSGDQASAQTRVQLWWQHALR
jgi:hypothetical protein